MTRREFYKKFKPVVDDWLEKFRKNGSLAIENAYDIAVVKEVMFFLDVEADDQDDDVSLFDDVPPEYFLDDILNLCGDWDRLGGIFIPDCGQSFETYSEMLGIIGEDWKQDKEEAEKDGEKEE